MKAVKYLITFLTVLSILIFFLPVNTVFSVDSPDVSPQIDSISPQTVHIGDEIIIEGSNFSNEKLDGYVTFYYGIEATDITLWSDTRIILSVPKDAVTGPVTVTTQEGTSTGYDIEIQDIVPSVAEFSINRDQDKTDNRQVVLNNTCNLEPTYYMASESDCFCDGTEWTSYTDSPQFTLSQANGEKTVYFKVRDEQGNESEVVSDTIILMAEEPLSGPPEFPFMHIDSETLLEWKELDEKAPKAPILPETKGPSTGSYYSLINHLDYTPGERSQGSCSNCWAWAGTGVMEVALSVEEGIEDRLSIQYLNSFY